jgi:hypothetical protein
MPAHIENILTFLGYDKSPACLRPTDVASLTNDEEYLKALSLYLNSDFVLYHQFFRATQFGVQRKRANLGTLRELPIPIGSLSTADFSEWIDLHGRLASARPVSADGQLDLFDEVEKLENDSSLSRVSLIAELNQRVADALNLTIGERVRFKAAKGLFRKPIRYQLTLHVGKLDAPWHLCNRP